MWMASSRAITYIFWRGGNFSKDPTWDEPQAFSTWSTSTNFLSTPILRLLDTEISLRFTIFEFYTHFPIYLEKIPKPVGPSDSLIFLWLRYPILSLFSLYILSDDSSTILAHYPQCIGICFVLWHFCFYAKKILLFFFLLYYYYIFIIILKNNIIFLFFIVKYQKIGLFLVYYSRSLYILSLVVFVFVLFLFN